jgi:diketogulonate reductase-like aldo/keto reductase
MNTMKLNNGMEIPLIGFGVYLIHNKAVCKQSVLIALKNGCRLIDTAAMYGNEDSVGQAMRESGIDRKEIFLTTKIWVSDFGYEKTKMAVDGCLKRLGVESIDLLLLHQAFDDYLGSWKALEEAVAEGKVRSIGISNFGIPEIENLMKVAKIKPVLNQVQCYPYLQQRELKQFMNELDIALEAWYPIGHGDKKLLTEEVFTRLAGKYHKSNVQIILRWHIQEGNIAIPKSTNPQHIQSNLDIFDFALAEEEMNEIRLLDKNEGSFKMLPIMKFFMRLMKIKN